MAFTGNFMCTSFKVELLKGLHDFTNGNDQFKLALYTNSASFTAATTDYWYLRCWWWYVNQRDSNVYVYNGVYRL